MKEKAHILSNEVFDKCLKHKKGPRLQEEKLKECKKELKNPINLRMKTQKGNRSTDRINDNKIKKSIDNPNIKLTNKVKKRLKNQFQSLQKLNLPIPVKKNIRSQFSNLKDKKNNTIIRSNAKINI